MARPYILVPYTAFACPECGGEVNPSENIFCGNCGLNLTFIKQLEKKTFYKKDYYDEWEKCQKCGEIKVVESSKWYEDENIPKRDGFCYRYTYTYTSYVCRNCGYSYTGVEKRYLGS